MPHYILYYTVKGFANYYEVALSPQFLVNRHNCINTLLGGWNWNGFKPFCYFVCHPGPMIWQFVRLDWIRECGWSIYPGNPTTYFHMGEAWKNMQPTVCCSTLCSSKKCQYYLQWKCGMKCKIKTMRCEVEAKFGLVMYVLKIIGLKFESFSFEGMTTYSRLLYAHQSADIFILIKYVIF